MGPRRAVPQREEAGLAGPEQPIWRTGPRRAGWGRVGVRGSGAVWWMTSPLIPFLRHQCESPAAALVFLLPSAAQAQPWLFRPPQVSVFPTLPK